MTKQRHPYTQAYRIACQLVEKLRPACERIEIAGSLRRRRETIGDIEIVAIPLYLVDLFGNPGKQSQLDLLLNSWPIELRKNGDRFKQFDLTASGGGVYPVDLFLVKPETWGMQFVIRTGPADFSRQMVTSRDEGGLRPPEYLCRDGRVWHNGIALDTPEERDVFGLWGMDYPEPEDRDKKHKTDSGQD